MIKKLYVEKEIKELLAYVKKTEIEQLEITEASSLIARKRKEQNNE